MTGCVSLGKFSAILTGGRGMLAPKEGIFGEEADYCAMTMEADFLTGGHLPLCDFLSVQLLYLRGAGWPLWVLWENPSQLVGAGQVQIPSSSSLG